MKSMVWQVLFAIAILCAGCPQASSGSDAPIDVTDASVDVTDAPVPFDRPVDLGDDLRTPDAPPDLGPPDVPVSECVPGRSVACACVDGRMGAQLCLSSRVWGPCVCVVPDAGNGDVAALPDAVVPSDVALAPLGPRLLAPQSVSRVTSRRPTMRWVLPEGVTRARVEVCGDRACTRLLAQQEVSGTSWRPTSMLAPGVTWWRVQGLSDDGSVAWTSATWEFVVGARDAPVDTSFGTVKDFNGDGFDDVVLAVEHTDDLTQRVNVYNGRRGVGETSATSQQFTASPSGEDTTRVLFGVGDFNGDGYADLATDVRPRAPAPDYVYLRAGGPAGLRSEPVLYLTEHEFPGYALSAVAASDFNGDGFSDLAVVANPLPDGTTRAGEVYLFNGTRTGISATPDEVIDIPLAAFSLRSPYTFVPIGDVNGDGFADALVGAGPMYAADERGVGWILSGHPTAPLQGWIRLNPPTSRLHFGDAASGVGDVNGDGIADFAIRSDEEVSIYLGRSGEFPRTPVRSIQSPEAPCSLAFWGFGSALGAPGDYNGDGRADVVIGARCLPIMVLDQHGPGMVFVYAGQSTGVSDTPLIFRGTHPNTAYGAVVGGVGDFDGDGYGDLAVGRIEPSSITEYVPVRLWVYLGATTGPQEGAFWAFGLNSRGGVGRIFRAIAMNFQMMYRGG